MFQRLSMLAGIVLPLLLSVPAHASDVVYPGGGTLSQIVDGGGTYTIITLVNLNSNLAAYQLAFYDDNGNPLTLSTTLGVNSSFAGALNGSGSLIIQTNGGGANVVEGYAVLTTAPIAETSTGQITSFGNQIAASAVFSIPLSSGVVAQASCPMDTGQDYVIAIPFDETGDATSAQTGVAIANSVSSQDVAFQPLGKGETALIQVAILDQNGNQIPIPAGQVDTIILNFGAHTSFMLDQQYPQIIGQKGTVVFTGSDSNGYYYDVKVLGLRATPTTFTSITPIIPCNPQQNSSGEYYCYN